MNEENRARIVAMHAAAEIISDRRNEAAEGHQGDSRRERRSRRRPPSGERSLPTIRLAPGETERIVDEAEAALMLADRDLYQRGDAIVTVAVSPAKAAHGREISALRVVERSDHALLEDISSSARFERFDKRSQDYVTADAPMWIVPTLRGRTGRLRLRILSGVVSAPTLRADGSILRSPGYDEMTGLVFDPRGVAFPDIPDTPSRSEAETAFARLSELLATFPFADEISRSVGLSALMTAIARPSLPTAPMHTVSAPVAGSGKSKLIDVASMIALGHEAAVLSYGADEQEFEKRLGAVLLAGAQFVSIDNVEGRPLEGELLCQSLTQLVVSPRILGQSKAPPVSTVCFFAATGNNLVVRGDLTRRALMCRLDAGMERPETREFEWDPVEVAKARRPEYVAAALTVLRAWHQTGMAGAPRSLGSYVEWSNLIRGALIWMGAADPVDSMAKLRISDPVLESLRVVLNNAHAAMGSESFTAAEVIALAAEARNDGYSGTEFARPELREAILMVAARGGLMSGQKLGLWLGKYADRVVDGLRFVKAGDRQGSALWAVRSA